MLENNNNLARIKARTRCEVCAVITGHAFNLFQFN